MNVDTFFTPSIVHVQRSTPLQEAAVIMRRHHVGALVVIDDATEFDQRPVGIVTDRDIVIKAVAEGLSAQRATVGDIMTQALATILRTDTLQQALELMRTRGVRRLAVAEADGALAGILSLDDVVDAFGAELAGLQGIARNEIAREITAVSNLRTPTGAART